jgi:predicted Zn-ribbon and HTH transcriptional regulator
MTSETEGAQAPPRRGLEVAGCALGCASLIALLVLFNLAIRWGRGAQKVTANPFTIWAVLALVLAVVGFVVVLSASGKKSAVPAPTGCRRCGEAFGDRTRLAAKKVSGMAFGPDLQDQLEALAMLPYRCRSCSSLVHQKCAHSQPCPQCGGSVFDQV